jgi:hypothetical protein
MHQSEGSLVVKRAPNTDGDLGWEVFWLRGLFLKIPASLLLWYATENLLHPSELLTLFNATLRCSGVDLSDHRYRPLFVPAQLRGKRMPKKPEIDWDIFWFREVLFLSLPVLAAVLTLGKGDHIHSARLAGLIGILLCLTMINLSWAWYRRAPR